MKREEKNTVTKKKIIDVSRNLFLKQGYTNTTIRQIVANSGMTTGSIYNFFHDKEDILKFIASEFLVQTDEIISSIVDKKEDPTVRYALIITLQQISIEGNANIADLHINSYGLWCVNDLICQDSAKRNRVLFNNYLRKCSDDDLYTKSLIINGIIHQCLSEFVFRGVISCEKRVEIILTIAFMLFGIPNRKIKPAIARSQKILDQNKVTMYGIVIKKQRKKMLKVK